MSGKEELAAALRARHARLGVRPEPDGRPEIRDDHPRQLSQRPASPLGDQQAQDLRLDLAEIDCEINETALPGRRVD